MQEDPAAVRRAIGARADAAHRVRRLTGTLVAVAAALTAAFTALAAASTHPRRIASSLPRVTHRTLRPVVAPAPPLVAVQDAAQPPPPQTAAPDTPPAAAPFASPVVVSGGS